MSQLFRYGENDMFFQHAQNAGAVFRPTGCLRSGWFILPEIGLAKSQVIIK
jgi:hypothetical protein